MTHSGIALSRMPAKQNDIHQENIQQNDNHNRMTEWFQAAA